jgi:hypothetical protein
MRTAQTRNGKFTDAVVWAKDMAAFAEKRFKLPKVQVFLDAFGSVGTIRWVVDYDDLAALERAQNQLLTDNEYHQKVQQAASNQLFIDGSGQDIVLRSL